ncbi:MAG: hypothetical protein ACJARD_001479 [Alphaproteobacteria bacterium]|jgi:hypothetical protein
MKQPFLWLLSLWVVLFSGILYARPVSYPDGWTLMTNHDAFENDLHIHYTPNINYSVGYKGIYFQENNAQFHGIQFNYLLKRINKRASQANFYLKSGIGMHHIDNDNAFAGFTGFAADWEDRDYFVMYENRLFESANLDRNFMQKSRIGITPYVGDYGDLHTWFMLQAMHRPNSLDNKDKVTITPMFRFFKDDYLGEVGVSSRGQFMFNLIIRH